MDYYRSIRLVFVGALLSLAGVVLVINHLMTTLSDIANEQDVIRSTRAVEAAMRSEREKLSSVLVDNAAWGDAVRHVYGEPDAAWLQSNWGNSTEQGNYDIVVLLDSDGSTLWSRAGFGLPSLPFEGYTGSSAATFIQKLPGNGALASVTDTFLFDGAPVVVGAAPLVFEGTPSSGPVRFLVFAKMIDGKTISSIAEKTVVTDLHLADAGPSDPQWSSTPIRNNAGMPLVFAVWHDMRPGDIGRQAVAWPAAGGIIFLIGSVAWLLHIAWKAVRAMQDRQQEQSRLLRMIDDMPVAVMTVEPENFNINYVNETSKQLVRNIEHLLPLKADDLIGTSIDVFHRHPEHQRRILSDPANLPYNARITLGPEILDLKISPVRDDDGSYIGPMLTWALVTKEVEAENRIRQLAHYDSLTGLANRSTFHEQKEKALARPEKQIALLFIDLDGFKLVNDTRGHRVGDQLLLAVSDRLRVICSDPRMTIGRLGGDEFAVMSAYAEEHEIERLAGGIIDTLSSPYDLESNRQIQIGASIGIAFAPKHGVTGEALLARADIALYAAKAAGKGTWRIFADEMESRIQERMRLQTELRASLQTNEGLFVFYQPIVDTRSGKVTAREALVRWHHPQRGWISPGEFVPIAEQSGLIDQLGEFVLNTACRDAAGWEDGARVAVNVSAVQLGKGTITPSVQTALAKSGLSPDRLEIEVTETAMLDDEHGAIRDLHRIRGLGVRVALDDFGTGYSSLIHLRAFPFDKIKIDGSFVKDAVERPESAAVVRAIADLGKRLGVTTVAEGVETEAHLARVLEEGCVEVQGYFYGRPVPSERDAATVAELNRTTAGAGAVSSP